MTAEHLFHRYLTLCADVGRKALPFIEWSALCEYLVPVTNPPGFPIPKKSIDTDVALRHKPRRTDDAIIADIRENHFRIGELQTNGGLQGVRRRTRPNSEKGILLARVCRACRQFLPLARYSRQGKGHRAICKPCDGARRIARRNNALNS